MTGADLGSRVRQAREQRGLSLSDAARMTKLSHAVLRAIERSDFNSLPAGMYRKAYLRTVATEVGLDPIEITATYEQLYETPIEPAIEAAAPDPWVAELVPSRRDAVVTLAVLAGCALAWFSFRSGPPPATPQMHDVESASYSRAAPGADHDSVPASNAMTAPDLPLRIDLTTTGWCWVTVESDGERVVYGLLEPGRRVVAEGRRVMAVRLGNAGAVRMSINGGPARVPGAIGEVVELHVTDETLAKGGFSD